MATKTIKKTAATPTSPRVKKSSEALKPKPEALKPKPEALIPEPEASIPEPEASIPEVKKPEALIPEVKKPEASNEMDNNVRKLSNFRNNLQREIGKIHILTKDPAEPPTWWKKKAGSCEEYIPSQVFIEELKEFGNANYQLFQFQKDVQKDFKSLSEQQKKNFLKLKHDREHRFKNCLLCLKDITFQSKLESERQKINNRFNKSRIDFDLLKAYFYFYQEVERMIGFFKGSFRDEDPLKNEKIQILKEFFFENFGCISMEEFMKKHITLPRKPEFPKRQFGDWRDKL